MIIHDCRLYGITCAQTLYYFYHNRGDRYVEKTWVSFGHANSHNGVHTSQQVIILW